MTVGGPSMSDAHAVSDEHEHEHEREGHKRYTDEILDRACTLARAEPSEIYAALERTEVACALFRIWLKRPVTLSAAIAAAGVIGRRR
jgi:hypothetical protein